MSSTALTTRTAIIPCLLYRDAPGAIEWLCSTYGFQKGLVVPGPDNTIVHAQLSFGHGMLMLGSADRPDSEFSRLVKPATDSEVQTQAVYVVVPDADAVYERVRAAGARIVIDIQDEDYGSRGFTCRDLEGHVWSFGTYDPYV